jgi:cytochrome c oxidase subunit III
MDLGIGTLEPLETEPVKRKRRPRSTFGGGRSSGGDNGGNKGGGSDGGGGGSDSYRFDKSPNDAEPNDKSRILTGFLLLVVLMTFCGLMGAYVVVATNKALEWRPFDLPLQIWVSTIVIFLSSITFELGKRSVLGGETEGARRWLVATAALGGVFVASQLLVWILLVSRGFYMRGNPYAGFFYILTAAHAVHVIGGMIALGATLLRSWHPARSESEQYYRTNLAKSVGWYWHFMGGLWIALFGLLGFWK